jgi:hypothetical protein
MKVASFLALGLVSVAAQTVTTTTTGFNSFNSLSLGNNFPVGSRSTDGRFTFQVLACRFGSSI